MLIRQWKGPSAEGERKKEIRQRHTKLENKRHNSNKTHCKHEKLLAIFFKKQSNRPQKKKKREKKKKRAKNKVTGCKRKIKKYNCFI